MRNVKFWGLKGLGLLLLLTVLLAGCWGQRELDTISLVLAIGMDAREKNQTLMTFQVLKPSNVSGPQSGGGSGGPESEPTHLVQSQARNIFNAIRNVTLHHSRRINFTHNLVLVIGEKAAQRGVRQVLDLMLRDAETRPNQQVVVTTEEASDILKVKPHLETVTAIEIEKILNNAGATSKVHPVILQELMEALLDQTTAATLPVIRIEKQEQEPGLIMDGTAVFMGDQWKGTLNPIETRGYLWVIGKVKSGIVVAPTADGGLMSMEIVRASGKFEPEMDRGKLKMKITVEVETNVGSAIQTHGQINVVGLRKLSRQTEAVVNSEIKSALQKAQTLKSDIFGFGKAVYRRYPRQWNKIEPVWNRVFSELQVEIRVHGKVRQVGKITEPI